VSLRREPKRAEDVGLELGVNGQDQPPDKLLEIGDVVLPTVILQLSPVISESHRGGKESN